MRLSLSVLLLAFTSSAVAADPPFCAAAASSCTSYGSRTASKCSSIISSQSISRATCRKLTTSTTTTTRTVRPTTTTTKTIRATTISSTVTSTSTKWGPTVTFPPTTIILSTRTHTIKITTTLPAETPDVFKTTTITTETSSEFAATTTTTTEYPQVPYAQETCSAPAKRDLHKILDGEEPEPKRFDFRASPARVFNLAPRAAAFPAECSCYLTVTSTVTTPFTKTTTTTRRVTKTSTSIIGGSVPTKTTTTTIWKSTSIPGTTRTQSTIYSTSTTKTTILFSTTQPSYTTTTLTETSTTTTTVIDSTTTATTSIPQMADPCDPANVNNLVVSGTLSNPDVLNGMMGDADNLSWCCYDCYWNKDCVYWVFDPNQWLCLVYYSNWRKGPLTSCTTDTCPRGYPALKAGPSDGRTFGLGSCAGPVTN